jgi:hypothetical protein
MTDSGGPKWDELKWKRKLETFGFDDEPVHVEGPDHAADTLWYLS